MNDTLKVAGRIGAELGAAKAENDRLRGLLRECRPAVQREVEKWTRASAILPVNANTESALLSRIDAALSQQAEPQQSREAEGLLPEWWMEQHTEPSDTFTAVDMATAAAQGFRDGQAAQVSYPDFRPQLSALVKACQRYIDSDGAECFPDDALIEATVALERDAHAASVRYAARPAQTEQQPIYQIRPRENVRDWLDTNADGYRAAKAMASMEARVLYAAPIAQTAPHESEHHAQLLGQALGECIAAAGIIRPDASLSGPQLLMFADDLKRHLAEQTAPQPEQSGWASAAERVPAENDGEVLVLMADGTCEIAWASYWHGARTDFAGWTFRDPDEDRTPTHWMPLPALSAQGQSNGDS